MFNINLYVKEELLTKHKEPRQYINMKINNCVSNLKCMCNFISRQDESHIIDEDDFSNETR